MNVDSILLSEYAATDPLGRLTVVNVFNILGGPGPKWGSALMALSLVIHGHSKEAGTKHEGRVLLLNSKRENILEEDMTFEFAFPKKASAGMPVRHIVTITILGAVFPRPGPHTFEVFIDGTYHASTNLLVERRKKA